MRGYEFLDRGVLVNPQGLAFTNHDNSHSLTYEDTEALTHQVAAALHRDGILAGEAVGIVSQNSVAMFPHVLGIGRAGCAWVQLSYRNSANDIGDVLSQVTCRFVFVAFEMRGVIPQLRAAAPGVERFVLFDSRGDFNEDGAPWLDTAGVRVAPLPPDREGIGYYNGTGGTTGRSKVVALSHRALETMTLAFLAHMPDSSPVHLVAAPLTHAAGCLVWPTLAVGGVNVIHAGVDAIQVLSSIERNRVTRLFLPPTAIYSLLAHPSVSSYDYSSLRHFLYAAAPMSAAKLRGAVAVFGPVMAQCYGQAEAPMLATFLSPQEHAEAVAPGGPEQRLLSCGRPTVVAQIGVLDEEGTVCGDGVIGEIVIRSSLVMNEYVNNPEQNAAVAKANGWHATGDVGYIDVDGYVYIVDRTRDMIITGGFNVYPSEVEQIIWQHPAVNDCAVIGIPDDKWGEAVTAVIELKPGAYVEADEIIALCKEGLGSVKAPKTVIFRALPRSSVGKVLKRSLRDEYWEGQGRKV